MKREKFVLQYIAESENIITDLTNATKDSFSSVEEKPLPFTKISSLIDHCRNSLDYMCKDIYEVCINSQDQKKTNNHFPYGNDKASFKARCGSVLPKLWEVRPDIYNKLEEIQAYRSNKDWLFCFCSLSNTFKHDIPDQKVTTKVEQKFTVGSLNVTQTGGVMNIVGNNNEPILTGITIDSPIEEFKERGIPVIRRKEIGFVFESINKPILPFLTEVVSEIKAFSYALYPMLTK